MPLFSACKINKLFLEKKENAIFFLQNDIYNIFYGYLCTYFIIIIS